MTYQVWITRKGPGGVRPKKFQIFVYITKSGQELEDLPPKRFCPKERLGTAIVTNQYHTAKVFLNAGLSPDIRDERAQPMLMVAVAHKREEMVQLLLSYNANPSLSRYDGCGNFITPLRQAITAILEGGDVDCLARIVGYLLDAGAKITDFGTFSMMCHTKLPVKMLIRAVENGSDLADMVGDNGHTTVLHAAIRAQNDDYAYYVLYRFPKILDRTDHWDMSALHLALTFGKEQLARDLISKGIAVGFMDSASKTELWYAITQGYTDIVQNLLSMPTVDVNAGQSSSLIAAYEKKDLRVLAMLVRHPDIYIDEDMHGKIFDLAELSTSDYAKQVSNTLRLAPPARRTSTVADSDGYVSDFDDVFSDFDGVFCESDNFF